MSDEPNLETDYVPDEALPVDSAFVVENKYVKTAYAPGELPVTPPSLPAEGPSVGPGKAFNTLTGEYVNPGVHPGDNGHLYTRKK